MRRITRSILTHFILLFGLSDYSNSKHGKFQFTLNQYIIPDNENIKDYFDEDEVDEWEGIDSWEFETLEELRDALNRWVDNIYEKGIPENTKIQHTTVEGKLYLKMHHVFMTDKREEGKSDFFMTIEQIEGDE